MKIKFLTALLLIFVLAGCAAGPSPQPVQPLLDEAIMEFPSEFIFSSGSGGWMTILTLNADGTFEGDYHDSELGLTGEGYPNGTVYICTFQGQFADARPLDEHSYQLTLDSLTTDERPDEEIRDNILYAAAGPHGLDNGNPEAPALARDFILYMPDTPVADLDERLLDWWPGRFEDTVSETLGCFALWNREAGFGFFTQPITN